MVELRISLERWEHMKLMKAKGNMTWKEYLMKDIKRGEKYEQNKKDKTDNFGREADSSA